MAKKRVRSLYAFSISVIYLFAFASLYVQIPGLYGGKGVLPAESAIRPAPASMEAWHKQPSLLRFHSQLGLTVSEMMELLCLIGIVLSFSCALWPFMRNAWSFAILWLLYLSVFHAGQTFLWFQWDILLLETGFISILCVPLLDGRSWYGHHDSVVGFLVKWLCFRLMFCSGVVKLQSGCPTWWSLTALQYHYESQCIPTPLAWYAHNYLPDWFQAFSIANVFIIQIGISLLMFAPTDRLRSFAFVSHVFLQVLILLTGNYNFFNLNSLVLLIPLLSEKCLKELNAFLSKSATVERQSKPKRLRAHLFYGRLWSILELLLNVVCISVLVVYSVYFFNFRLRRTGTLSFAIDSSINFSPEDFSRFIDRIVPLVIGLAVVSLVSAVGKSVIRCWVSEKLLIERLRWMGVCAIYSTLAFGLFAISLRPFVQISPSTSLPPAVVRLSRMAHGYEISSSYGLFRRMTGVGGRPEVVMEGALSAQGPWKEIEFLYKPGNVSRRPPIVAPHQPRLDWQMWFAALGHYNHNPWLLNLAYRILKDEPTIKPLLVDEPLFTDKDDNAVPPKYVRAWLYHYHYSKPSSSDWWTRQRQREYFPPLSLDDPGLISYAEQQGLVEKDEKTASTDQSAGQRKPFSKASDGNVTAKLLLEVLRHTLAVWDGFSFTLGLFLSLVAVKYINKAR